MTVAADDVCERAERRCGFGRVLCLLDNLLHLGDASGLCLGEEALKLSALGLAVLLQPQGDFDCALPLVLAGLLALM